MKEVVGYIGSVCNRETEKSIYDIPTPFALRITE